MNDIYAAPKGYYYSTINDTLEMLPVVLVILRTQVFLFRHCHGEVDSSKNLYEAIIFLQGQWKGRWGMPSLRYEW